MTEKQAVEIIDKVRTSSPFTMGLSTEKFIEDFRKRYALIFSEVIPNNVIDVAKAIKVIEN